MKKVIFTILFIFLCNCLYAEIVRVVEKPDGSVAVIYPAKEGHTTEDFNMTMERDPNLSGLSYVDMDKSQLPGRADRDCWKLDNGKVKVDSAKKQAKEAEQQAKEAKRQSIKIKLGLDDSEWEVITNAGSN